MDPLGRQDSTTLAPIDADEALHVCIACDSELVQPEWWEEASGGAWQVGLRCPECETCREGVYSQRVVDGFDAVLNEGCDQLAATYRRMVRDNLVAELERFAGALRAGAILPEDF
jgi:hypothetical protein